jgi:tetratricopeptide (TPR) repeat protein
VLPGVDDQETVAWQARLRRLREERRFAELTAAVDASAFSGSPRGDLELARALLAQYAYDRALPALEALRERAPDFGPAAAWHIAALDRMSRFDEAPAVADEALSRHPASVAVRVAAGRLLSGRGQHERAVALLREAVELDAGSFAAAGWLADALLEAGRWAEAEAVARRLVEAHPAAPAAHAGLARLLIQRDRSGEALAAANQALALDDAHGRAWELKIEALGELRRWDEAAQAGRAALGRRPRLPGLHLVMGTVLGGQGRHEDSLRCFEQALALDPKELFARGNRVIALIDLRRWADAEAAARELVADHPEDPRPWTALGMVSAGRNRYEEALEHYGRALAVDPRSDVALGARVESLRALRRWDEAEEAARELVAAHPHDPQSHVSLGWVHDDQDHDAVALEHYRRALEVDPGSSSAKRRQVAALRALGRWEDAETAAGELIAAHPDDPNSYVSLALVHDDQDRDEEALAQYDRALRIDPRDSYVLRSRIDSLRALRRWDDAEAAAREVIALHPGDPMAYVNLGWVYDDQDRDEEALAQYERAVDVDPLNHAARRWQVAALRALRRWDEAEAAARDLIAAHPGDLNAHLNLGWVYDDQDRDEEALAQYERAVEIDPANYAARRAQVAVLRALRRWDEAETAGRALVAAHPGNPMAHVSLGWVHDWQNRSEEALARYQRALDIEPGNVYALRSRVDSFRALRRWDDAEAAARDLVAAHPGDPLSHLNLGWVHDDQDRDEEALAHYERALEIDPGHAYSWHSRIDALRALRRWDEAEAAARDLIAAHPGDPLSHLNLGWVHSDQGRHEEALAQFRRAAEIDPAHAGAKRWQVSALRELRRWDEAEAAARDLIAAHPGDPLSHLNLGWVHSDQDQDEEALAAFERAVEADPRNFTARRWQVAALRFLRRWEEAEAAARDLIAAHPRNPLAYAGLGWVLGDQGRDEEALAEYQRAVAVDPRDTGALRSRIDALRTLRRWDEAEAAARDLTATHPHNPDSYISLGWVHSDQDRDEEALAQYERALTVDPRSAAAARWRITALRVLRRWDEAEAAARDLIATHPGDPVSHITLGWVHSDQDRDEEALPHFARALAIDPRNGSALRSRFDCLLALRRWDDAEAAARHLITVHPNDPVSYVNLGWVFDEQDRHEEALEEYQRALAVHPENGLAQRWRIASLYALRSWGRAASAIEELTATRPRDPGAFAVAGRVLYLQGREEEALAQAERAFRLDPRHNEALELQVACLCSLRRWEEAEAAAHALASAHPNDPVSYVALSRVHASQGRHEEALAQSARALALDGNDEDAVSTRLETLLALHRWDAAEQLAREAIRFRPASPKGHVMLSQVYGAQERHDAALACAEEAVRVDPTYWEGHQQRVMTLVRLSRLDDAEQAARRLVEDHPNPVRGRTLLAEVLDAQHKYTEALALYEAAAVQDPTDPELVIARSHTLRSMRCFAEAETLITAAVERRPQATQLRIEHAYVLLERGDHGGADALFARIRRQACSPEESALALWGRGWAAMNDQRYQEASAFFTEASQARPHDPEVVLGLAWAALHGDGPRALETAETACRRLLVDNPRTHRAHTCLGMVAYRRKDYPAAERHFRRAVELAPYDGCHVDLGALYIQLGRFEEAEESLKRAVELDPWNADALVKLGSLYLLRAELEPGDEGGGESARLATREFRRARAVEPASRDAAIGLAVALAGAPPGDLVAAEDVLRGAIRQHSDDENLWQLHLTLARLLIQAGDADQSSEMYECAVREARFAIRHGVNQAETHFVAGVAEQRLGAQTSEVRLKMLHRQRAFRHFKNSERREPHGDASHAIRLLEQQTQAARASARRGGAMAFTAMAVLILMWVDFEWKHHATTVMVTSLTPVLVGLMAIGFLLPLLVRLKLPGGMEADLSASVELLSARPTGEFKISSRRLPAIARPTGQMPRIQHPGIQLPTWS